jgi:hypothetical protein
MNYKLIAEKQRELIDHISHYDESDYNVWLNVKCEIESELAQLESEPDIDPEDMNLNEHFKTEQQMYPKEFVLYMSGDKISKDTSIEEWYNNWLKRNNRQLALKCPSCRWFVVGYGHCGWCIYNSNSNYIDKDCKDNYEHNINIEQYETDSL